MPAERTCLQCNDTFVGRRHAMFCSDTCRYRYHSAQRSAGVKKPKDPEAQARGRANRAKGARVENELCHLIRELTGDEVRRNLSQTRDAGGDVKWGPFYFEVKYQKTLAMPAWQRQAVESAAKDPDGLVPAVVHRRPNEDFWINLPFKAFVAIFDALRKAATSAQERDS